MTTKTKATVPAAESSTDEATAPISDEELMRRVASYEERAVNNKERIFGMVRSYARHLDAAAATGDLDKLAHAAYMAICHLADEFTDPGTSLAMYNLRRIDRKRIDRIIHLGESLKRDRPYPYDPTRIVNAQTRPAFFDRDIDTWSWHDHEHFTLFLVGMLELPDIITHLEGSPDASTRVLGSMHHWMLEAARWLQDPRPIEEKGRGPQLPRDTAAEATWQRGLATEFADDPTDMEMAIDLGVSERGVESGT